MDTYSLENIGRTFTFATEWQNDDQYIPVIIKKLNEHYGSSRSVELINDELISDGLMEPGSGIFTFEVSEPISLRQMKLDLKMMASHFDDLHRVWQTANIGLDADDEWYHDDHSI